MSDGTTVELNIRFKTITCYKKEAGRTQRQIEGTNA